MRRAILSGILLCLSLIPFTMQAQNEDAEGCLDHPLVTRMPGFYITSCETKDFFMYNFPVGASDRKTEPETKKVEGKYYSLNYHLKDGGKDVSGIQILKNYENALKKIGATIKSSLIDPMNSGSHITAVISKDGKETWITTPVAYDNEYQLVIVEAEGMEQVVTANAMFEAISKDGFIALDIHFDTGKATIKQESVPVIEQIYEMLKANQGLSVSIEGHTDNTGTPAGNKKLSEDRAKSVVDALVTKGIQKGRLSSTGWGQEKPVADNRTEEGKAKNRRVEIVKK
jgi:OmpA-OmpF porin, OOP family